MCLVTTLILGSAVYHATTKYEPEEGYRTLTNSIGLQVEECEKPNDEWIVGGTAFYFNDSFGEPSYTAGATVRYNTKYPVDPAVALTYTDTSYYSGPVPMPYVQIDTGLKVFGSSLQVQIGGIPPLSNSDGIITIQTGFKF